MAPSMAGFLNPQCVSIVVFMPLFPWPLRLVGRNDRVTEDWMREVTRRWQGS
jgi:hypothetical protein